MANISAELAAILAARYGRDVRGSIHDAIDKINKASEVVMSAGTAVDSPTSSSTGFEVGSFYFNTTTDDLWKCAGTNSWTLLGNLKGADGADGADGQDGADGKGIASIAKTSTSGLVDTYTITYTDGTSQTYNVANGADGENGNKWYRGTGITGTNTNPTKFTGSGVTYAYANDNYLNTSTGAVYHCTTEGNPNNAFWVYDFVMSGGGSSITVVDNLTSQSSSDALSAKQGYVLKGLVDEKASTSDMTTSLAGKVDKVTGKGLSTNDYTNADKAIVDGVTSALGGKQDSLAAQTAYTSQGDATHVPQITTNSLGQVTGISEVEIQSGTNVIANPTLVGTEDSLTALQIGNTKYKVEGGSGGGYTLVITTNSALNGQMLTATKGSNTKRGLVANNQCRISLDEGGIWTIEEPINHHTVNTENLVYYGEYQYKLKSYTIYGFHVDDSKSNPNPSTIHENDMVSYHVQYGGENVDNYNYDYGYMDFANDEWIKGSWSDNEFFMPRPVLLKQDFSDKIYLNPYDLTRDVNGNSVNDKLTGSTDGYNAMMEFGRDGFRIWYKVVPDSDPTSYTVYVSDVQLDSGFHAWSFYDCNDELTEHFYMAIYNGSNVSSVLRSLSGKSILNNVAGTTEISYAKANNKNSETYAWYIDVYVDRVLINFLMMLVIRSANSDRIGYGNYTGGSSASSLLQTGLGNTKGFFYGKQANGVVKVFGIENWFANQWRRCAGYSLVNGVIKYKLTYGTADGSSSSGYIESTSAPTNYLTGNSIATNLSNSEIVKETAKTDGSLLPSAFGGSTSTNYCDSAWSATGTTFALVGGACYYSAACGAFCVCLDSVLSHAHWSIGAALSCKPPIR